MYLVNNAQLTRLPFFSRLFRPPGIFSSRISRLLLFCLFSPCNRRRSEHRGLKETRKIPLFVDQDQRELMKSRSFDPTRAREMGKIERELMCPYARARAYSPRECARACNVHPRALQALVLVNIRGLAGFGSMVPDRPCKNEVQRRTERVAGKEGEGEGKGWWFPLETEMESCARGDYARERNKKRDKDGDL